MANIVHRNVSMSLLQFLRSNNLSIIKPVDPCLALEEYESLLTFFVCSCRALNNMYPGNGDLEYIYDTYRIGILTSGEYMIDDMLIGPPEDEIRVLLNKYSAVIAEDVELLNYLFTYEDAVEGIKRGVGL